MAIDPALLGLTNLTGASPEMNNAMSRLKQIHDSWQQYPGRMPGGTGMTGIMPGDSKGWSDMLNEQIEAKNLENQLSGQAPVSVHQGPMQGQGLGPSLWDNPQWWQQGQANAPLQFQPNSLTPALAALRKAVPRQESGATIPPGYPAGPKLEQ